MDTSIERTDRSSARMWLGVVAGLFAILALAGVFLLELLEFGPRHAGPEYGSWLFWMAAIPAYALLQFFAETVLQSFLGAHALAVKAIPIVLIVLFYAAYFILVA